MVSLRSSNHSRVKKYYPVRLYAIHSVEANGFKFGTETLQHQCIFLRYHSVWYVRVRGTIAAGELMKVRNGRHRRKQKQTATLNRVYSLSRRRRRRRRTAADVEGIALSQAPLSGCEAASKQAKWCWSKAAFSLEKLALNLVMSHSRCFERVRRRSRHHARARKLNQH